MLPLLARPHPSTKERYAQFLTNPGRIMSSIACQHLINIIMLFTGWEVCIWEKLCMRTWVQLWAILKSLGTDFPNTENKASSCIQSHNTSAWVHRQDWKILPAYMIYGILPTRALGGIILKLIYLIQICRLQFFICFSNLWNNVYRSPECLLPRRHLLHELMPWVKTVALQWELKTEQSLKWGSRHLKKIRYWNFLCLI